MGVEPTNWVASSLIPTRGLCTLELTFAASLTAKTRKGVAPSRFLGDEERWCTAGKEGTRAPRVPS